MYRTIVARLPDYALQRRAMPLIGTSMAAPLEIDSRRENRPQHSDPHRHTGAGPPHRATAGSPRTLQPPPQAHPARRIGLISLTAPPLSCPWGAETKKRPKLQPFCDCGLSRSAKMRIGVQKHGKSTFFAAHFHLAGTQESPQSQKNCKRSPIFVFAE